jgi:membrane protein implicated in regulation of membrane protease activity
VAKAICLLAVLSMAAIGLAIGMAFWWGLAYLCWGSLATAPLWFQVVAGLSLAGAFGRSIRASIRIAHQLAVEVEREMARG